MKQFKCDICNAEFTSKHGMKGHIATIHGGKKAFKCVICEANFGHQSHLNRTFTGLLSLTNKIHPCFRAKGYFEKTCYSFP